MSSLNQRILILTQGPANEEGLIRGAVKAHVPVFKDAVERATRSQVSLSIYIPAYIKNELRPNDLWDFGVPYRYLAIYNKDFENILIKTCGVKPNDYDYIMRVYKHPARYVTGYRGGTMRSYNHFLGTIPIKKSYTAIIANPPAIPTPAPLWELMLHEYCHQLDSRFEDAGINSFIDPDRRGPLQSNPLFKSVSNADFYSKILANLEFPYNGRQAVPYQMLHGIAGVWR